MCPFAHSYRGGLSVKRQLQFPVFIVEIKTFRAVRSARRVSADNGHGAARGNILGRNVEFNRKVGEIGKILHSVGHREIGTRADRVGVARRVENGEVAVVVVPRRFYQSGAGEGGGGSGRTADRESALLTVVPIIEGAGGIRLRGLVCRVEVVTRIDVARGNGGDGSLAEDAPFFEDKVVSVFVFITGFQLISGIDGGRTDRHGNVRAVGCTVRPFGIEGEVGKAVGLLEGIDLTAVTHGFGHGKVAGDPGEVMSVRINGDTVRNRDIFDIVIQFQLIAVFCGIERRLHIVINRLVTGEVEDTGTLFTEGKFISFVIGDIVGILVEGMGIAVEEARQIAVVSFSEHGHSHVIDTDGRVALRLREGLKTEARDVDGVIADDAGLAERKLSVDEGEDDALVLLYFVRRRFVVLQHQDVRIVRPGKGPRGDRILGTALRRLDLRRAVGIRDCLNNVDAERAAAGVTGHDIDLRTVAALVRRLGHHVIIHRDVLPVAVERIVHRATEVIDVGFLYVAVGQISVPVRLVDMDGTRFGPARRAVFVQQNTRLIIRRRRHRKDGAKHRENENQYRKLACFFHKFLPFVEKIQPKDSAAPRG